MPVSETAELVDRCRQGDDLAWERLVRTFQGRVYALAYHYVRDADAARDLAQDIFVRVYQKIDTFSGQAFLPWLLRLTRNLCIDRLRRIKARPPAQDVPVEDDGQALAAAGPDPEQAWLADTSKRLVHTALGRMTERNREIIMLKDIQGLTFDEIAELLSVPVGTLKSRSHRARVELARQVLAIDPSYGASGRTHRAEMRQ